MKALAALLRGMAMLRFRLLGLATINDIPTEQFNALIESLLQSGWRKTYSYDGFDAWIDYGKVKLRKGRVKLTFEWDNWTEGSIEGPRSVLDDIAGRHGLSVSNEWRWSDTPEDV